MSDTDTTASTSTAPAPKARGPHKTKAGKNGNGSKTKRNGSDPKDARIAALEAQVAEANVRKGTLDTVPVASEENRPGTLIKVGVDASGAPMYSKVRYTRDWLIRNSPSIRWTPRRSMVVSPHGISWTLEEGEEVETPQIVKGIFDECVEAERLEALRNRPLSLAEKSELDNRAASTSGKHWSRLYRLAATGLDVRDEDGEDIG